MPLRTSAFLAFAILGGCAGPPQPPAQPVAPPARQAQAPQSLPSQSAIILAMRPVPADSPLPVQALLSGAPPRNDLPAAPLYEFVVRTGGGTTIAVVQRETGNLHPGEQVSIVSGAPPRISVPVIH